MPNLLVWTAVGLLGLSAALGPGTGQAQSQLQQLLEQGALQMQRQQFDEAIATFQKALKEEPQSAVTYNLLGMTYRLTYNQVRNQELKRQEIESFKKAVEIDPTYWVALINLGATYYYQGDKAKAAPLFKKALTLNPNHPERAQFEKMMREGGERP